MKLTEKQRAVLVAVYHYINEHDAPPSEYQASKVVRHGRLWPAGHDSGVFLHGHLRNLTERGLLERHGGRGNYHYSLTTEGRSAIA